MMDCNMPFMDGYDSTSNIKKLMASMDIEESKQPTIYGVTGHVEKEYVKRAIDTLITAWNVSLPNRLKWLNLEEYWLNMGIFKKYHFIFGIKNNEG